MLGRAFLGFAHNRFNGTFLLFMRYQAWKGLTGKIPPVVHRLTAIDPMTSTHAMCRVYLLQGFAVSLLIATVQSKFEIINQRNNL